jgi:glucose-1-phosphate cytidylyltransferase
MKAVILAGGLGTRISEETHLKPKPMIEIGGKPILWHIMKLYSAHGINDFVICCGYKGYVIKEYFANYFLHTSANRSRCRRRRATWRSRAIDAERQSELILEAPIAKSETSST